MAKLGKLFVVAAPSGSGKTTIVKNTRKHFPELVFSVSFTTRKKRENEVEGKDYFFISNLEFENKIKADEFVEWEEFYDYYYGTLKSFVDDNRNNGRSVIFDIDVKGAVSIKKAYPAAVLIYIMPPSIEVIKDRLINRKTETEADLEKRFKRIEMELSYKDDFDYIVVNDDLEKAKESVIKIVNNELLKEI